MTTDLSSIHILMTVYNVAPYIDKALSSLKEQDYQNFKVLLINDGSSDETDALVQQAIKDDPRFLYRSHPKNSGSIAAMREELIDWSVEEDPNAYFLWMDGDDQLLDSRFISKLMTKMHQTGADVCLYNFDVAFEDESEALRKNAAGLFKDKQNSEEILRSIQEKSGIIEFEDLPKVGEYTTLGWTKAYAPHMKQEWPKSSNKEMIFEDFLYLSTLYKADKITGFPAEYKPYQYLRRNYSATGDRKPHHFTSDVINQLADFKKNVGDDSDTKLQTANQIIEKKLEQYRTTLEMIIDLDKPGFEPSVLEDFDARASEIVKKADSGEAGQIKNKPRF